MEEDLYDEFGNYIGPELTSTQVQEDSSSEEETQAVAQSMLIDEPGQDVVLYEDKQFYPDLEQVYPQAQTLVMEEDTQPITEPILKPQKPFSFLLEEPGIPPTTYSTSFLTSLLNNQDLVRNFCLVGHLHHGKTSIVDLFVEETHTEFASDPVTQELYLNTREDERLRQISIKAKTISLVLPNSREKHYVFNIYDTPGHPNFSDEVTCSLRVSDGVLLVVDLVEGLTMNTEKLLIHALDQCLPVVLVLNKIDRLPLELRLPPKDAYFKIKYTIDQLNEVLNRHAPELPKFSPFSNIVFASGLYGIVFTVQSMAEMYARLYGSTFEASEFAKKLWGDLYFNQTTRKFTTQPSEKRSFVEFILEPLYKLVGYTISEEKEQLEKFLASVGIYFKKHLYTVNSKTFLKIVSRSFFGKGECLRDVIINSFPSPKHSQLPSRVIGEVPESSLVVQVSKQVCSSDCSKFYLSGLVVSGKLSKGDRVVCIEGEHTSKGTVSGLYIDNSRYKIPIEQAGPGYWVLIEGIETSFNYCTLVSEDLLGRVQPFEPLKFNTASIVKLALEPYNPSDLPQMLEGLSKCCKSYPLLKSYVEESGEHILLGTGELYLDCVLHDLRNLFTSIEIKLSDPFVPFCETVVDTSSFKCFADTPNQSNRIAIISEPLEANIAVDIEKERIPKDTSSVTKLFQEKYSWDILAAQNIWAFGPENNGPNVLVNDILPMERNEGLLGEVNPFVVQGFKWACSEGPLIEEPLRCVKFRMLEASISQDPLLRAGGQIIPTARKVCYSSLLLASPRLMEPYFITEIQCTQDCIPTIYTLLQRRRGHVNSESPVGGCPLFTLSASLPVVDSFGFETDLRTLTSGMAFCTSDFDEWVVVPGDPLDKTIKIAPLEPSPAPHLAREFMLKTRRRKGLTEEITVSKYFEDPFMKEMAMQDQDLADYF